MTTDNDSRITESTPTLELLVQITPRSDRQSSDELSKVDSPVLVIVKHAEDVACKGRRVTEAACVQGSSVISMCVFPLLLLCIASLQVDCPPPRGVVEWHTCTTHSCETAIAETERSTLTGRTECISLRMSLDPAVLMGSLCGRVHVLLSGLVASLSI